MERHYRRSNAQKPDEDVLHNIPSKLLILLNRDESTEINHILYSVKHTVP